MCRKGGGMVFEVLDFCPWWLVSLVWSLDKVPKLYPQLLQFVNAQLNQKQIICVRLKRHYSQTSNVKKKEWIWIVHAILSFWFSLELAFATKTHPKFTKVAPTGRGWNIPPVIARSKLWCLLEERGHFFWETWVMHLIDSHVYGQSRIRWHKQCTVPETEYLDSTLSKGSWAVLLQKDNINLVS